MGRQARPGDGEGLKRMAVIRADPGAFDAFWPNGVSKTFVQNKSFFRSGFTIRGALRQMIANKGLAFTKASPQKPEWTKLAHRLKPAGHRL